MAAFRLLQKIGRKNLISSSIRPLFTQGRLASSQSERSEWPDDGLGLDSYANLSDVSAQTKAPNGSWDTQERRNFGDTLHESDDALNVWMYDAPEKSLYPP
ncbi:NADH dehydrogenase [ubiquinone] 1 beta subcomplex subunit 8, mitochondrial-like, partial [Paramuricea clavata]